MLYRGYWIDFVSLSQDGDALFLIRRRHEREILAEADSISQALDIVRALEVDTVPFSRNRRKAVSA
jgi:hypothetical protein